MQLNNSNSPSLNQLPVHAREAIVSGMRSPRAVTLGAGEVLYRFASSDAPEATWAAGPWWLYERDFQKIVEQFRLSREHHGEDGLTLGWLGRVAAAVRQGWSRTDVLVKASVRKEVGAFSGRGRTQHKECAPNGILYTYSGWPEVEQLYLPGIGDHAGLTPHGAATLHIIWQQKIESQQLFERL
ncbi:MAG: hypothetical protein ABW208_24805 [Pyrinomonadaceae bacterium]